jgi:hypothetical protein
MQLLRAKTAFVDDSELFVELYGETALVDIQTGAVRIDRVHRRLPSRGRGEGRRWSRQSAPRARRPRHARDPRPQARVRGDA